MFTEIVLNSLEVHNFTEIVLNSLEVTLSEKKFWIV